MNQKMQVRLILNIKKIINKVSHDNITGYAAESCYFMLLSLIPFLMVLMSLVHYLPFTSQDLLNLIDDIIPTPLIPYVTAIISDLYDNASLTLTSITAIGVIWSAGKGFMSIMKGLNQIYQTKSQKNWIVQRIIATFYSLLFMASIIATMVIVVFGNLLLEFIGRYLPNIRVLFVAILNNKMIFTICIMLLIILVMFRFVPNGKSSLAREFPGALFAAVVWYGFSLLFSLYVNYSPNFSNTYGGLTILIISLMWIYFCMIIVFLGAEINALFFHR